MTGIKKILKVYWVKHSSTKSVYLTFNSMFHLVNLHWKIKCRLISLKIYSKPLVNFFLKIEIIFMFVPYSIIYLYIYFLNLII